MKRVRAHEDASTQAGWMFADLFLALTVIFLATVSFVPSGNYSAIDLANIKAAKNISNSLENSALTLISNGFIGEYKTLDTAKFSQDLKTYLKLKDLPSNTKALYLEVVGHTAAYGEANDAGNLEALNFVIDAKKYMSTNFDGTNTSINLSPDVAAGKIRIKVTFI